MFSEETVRTNASMKPNKLELRQTLHPDKQQFKKDFQTLRDEQDRYEQGATGQITPHDAVKRKTTMLEKDFQSS